METLSGAEASHRGASTKEEGARTHGDAWMPVIDLDVIRSLVPDEWVRLDKMREG